MKIGVVAMHVAGMDGKGDCFNCPISMWVQDFEDANWRCPLVNAQNWWEKCPMEFVEVKDETI